MAEVQKAGGSTWRTIAPAKNAQGYGFGVPPKEDVVRDLRQLADAIESGAAITQSWEKAEATSNDDFAFDRLVLDMVFVRKRA